MSLILHKQKPPIRHYSKYKSQTRTNVILNKLSDRMGCTNEIITVKDPESFQNTHCQQNYLQQNKKNLKNFFKERIPEENFAVAKLMKIQPYFLHPKRISEIKKIQQDLKSQTKMGKMNYVQDISKEKQYRKQSFDKVKHKFYVNDKNKELRQKYGGQAEFTIYDSDNHKRGTFTQIEKRSKVIKKEAYQKVFGPDISSISRTAAVGSRRKSDSLEVPKHSQTLNLNKNVENEKKKIDRKTLSVLLSKMTSYRNKLQQKSDEYIFPDENVENSENEQNMIGLIKNITHLYKGRSVENRKKIQNLEDLYDVNKRFYNDMKNHKKQRLAKRMQFIGQKYSNTLSFSKASNVYTPRDQKPINYDLMSSMNDFNQSDCESQQKIQYVVKDAFYRFKLLRKMMVKWASHCVIYGIKREHLYAAFRRDKTPYNMEGSYAFFKCIKLGDLQSVKTFVNEDINFAYELQFNGKSTFSYACYHNQTDIAIFLLSLGMNYNHICNSKRTPLYYALLNHNLTLVKEILLKGVSPWSSNDNPYSQMMKGQNSLDTLRVFNNARKLHTGMQLFRKISEKQKFWKKQKNKIVGQWIEFNQKFSD